MKLLLLIPALAALTVLTSCKKEDDSDTQAPTFTSILINENEMLSVSENVISNGNALTLQIEVNDNVALSELTVEIHEAGDGHDHERIKKSDDEALAFGPKIYDLENAQTKTIDITVSDLLDYEATDYHLELILLDQSANRTTTVQVFEIE